MTPKTLPSRAQRVYLREASTLHPLGRAHVVGKITQSLRSLSSTPAYRCMQRGKVMAQQQHAKLCLGFATVIYPSDRDWRAFVAKGERRAPRVACSRTTCSPSTRARAP